MIQYKDPFFNGGYDADGRREAEPSVGEGYVNAHVDRPSFTPRFVMYPADPADYLHYLKKDFSR